ncbi:hypothetical protein [Paenibacillus sp. RC67]|uniref:MORN repeat-containing protein n=1 Tax=Paenibacillus sp. RC67 TaxID=3039392 RepID=UPI0024AE5AB5|nr:hypothetical protein [Paenibacillus sp. RC67]
MKNTNFDFIKGKLPEFYALAAQAEFTVDSNPLQCLNHLQRLGRMLTERIITHEDLKVIGNEPLDLLEALIHHEIIPPPLISPLKRVEYLDPRESELLLDPTEVKRLLLDMYDLTGWYYKTYIDDKYAAKPMYLQPQLTSLSSIQGHQEGGEHSPAWVVIEGREYAADWQERVENEQHVEIGPQESYQGQMWNGMKHGKGRYQWSDGTQYLGLWSRDVEHGTGTKLFANGDRYHGEWKDGFFHGKGIYEWKDGTKFEGCWEYNLEHGFGIQTRSDGTVRRGLWANGEFILNQDQIKE